MNKKLKRVLTILGITIGASLAVAILIGILNALVANGTWSFGWSDYRYDESGYEVGEGSVFSDDLTTLSIDWIDGEVRIVSCGDQYISLSETSDEKLGDESLLRYRVSENGTELSVKYRASSWYFGNAKNKNKILTVRIPERLFQQLEHISISGISTDITLDGQTFAGDEGTDLTVRSLVLKTESGEITVRDVVCRDLSITNQKGNVDFEGSVEKDLFCFTKSGKVDLKPTGMCEKIDVETTSGEVRLLLPDTAAFSLSVEHEKKINVNVDFPYEIIDGKYVCGTNGTSIKVTTVKGNVTVTR